MLSHNGGAAAQGTEEKREIQGKGDPILVLAGNAVVVEEGLDLKLSDRLEVVAIDEIVEEEDVVWCEVEVTDSINFFEGWYKASL